MADKFITADRKYFDSGLPSDDGIRHSAYIPKLQSGVICEDNGQKKIHFRFFIPGVNSRDRSEANIFLDFDVVKELCVFLNEKIEASNG